MDALGVARPTAVLRVTEHMDAIIAYVARIIENRYAYATPSGVCVTQGARARRRACGP